MRVFVTGAAGFIGFHAAARLLAAGHAVATVDDLNDYYDPRHKHRRLAELAKYPTFTFAEGNIADQGFLANTWRSFRPTHVLHLAAQAGVRYSLERPSLYVQSNIVGFQNVIELVRAERPKNFVFASSSSVYGNSSPRPFAETTALNDPASFYAATKLSNEIVAKSYVNLFDIPSTALRFFTVYGAFARPDMALYSFAEAIESGRPIKVFNNGDMSRDFTYVDDIVDGVCAALERPFKGEVINLGFGRSIPLLAMIEELGKAFGVSPRIERLPMQPGDMFATQADIEKAKSLLGYAPKVDISEGIMRFAAWFKGRKN